MVDESLGVSLRRRGSQYPGQSSRGEVYTYLFYYANTLQSLAPTPPSLQNADPRTIGNGIFAQESCCVLHRLQSRLWTGDSQVKTKKRD